MEAFETFREHLQEALTHLYDPSYHPPGSLWTVTGSVSQQGSEAVQTAIKRAIEALEPAPSVPPTARIRRIYRLLQYRYIQGLTQAETAARLNITPRHLRREQREAVDALAQRIWEQGQIRHRSRTAEIPAPESPLADSHPSSWRSQMRQELASLQKNAPGSVADVEKAIRGAVELQSALATQNGIRIEITHAPPGLYASIHPSALRQILIIAIRQLAQHVSSGSITLRADRKAEYVQIAITGHPTTADIHVERDLFQEIIRAQNGSVRIDQESSHLSFQIQLPVADKVTVLVVDDNLDLVHFYRRYTASTRYHLVHIAQGRRVFETIEDCAPEMIVLDVMLPDIDGWELLVRLHEHPDTRHIPIIVCSVIREQELALALGAVLHLPKPVRRREFVHALDHVLGRFQQSQST